MNADFDLVIRNGRVIDGTGAEPRVLDVAVKDGKIAALGRDLGAGREEVDASGLLVTPGFVDIHTHYDGQLIWNNYLEPSSSHGVTTVVAGNCGVGFAPCRADDHQRLISVMEGVEDIPNVVMSEGLTWEWETFPQFLDALEARPHDIDYAVYLPHSPLRIYAMGERGERREPATDEDLAAMKKIARGALEAGAIGFATSTIPEHRTPQGNYIPSYDADERELHAIAEALKEAGHGLLQIAPNWPNATDDEARAKIDMFARLSTGAGITVTFGFAQLEQSPDRWRDLIRWIGESEAEGAVLRPQFFCRPVGVVIGHSSSVNPFCFCPSYEALAKLPLDERIVELRKPEVRARLLSETPVESVMPLFRKLRDFNRMFEYRDPPNYEPALDTSISAVAAQRGITPEELAYDLLLAEDGKAMLYVVVANYADGNVEFVKELAPETRVVFGLGDGGAHYGFVCDAGYPTYMLSYLARDRKAGRLPLTEVVKALTSTPAEVLGMSDRGVLAPGYKADINVIDYDALQVKMPEVRKDLPAGGLRLHQRATGYRYTYCSGELIRKDDAPTGKLPGKLVRGGQAQ